MSPELRRVGNGKHPVVIIDGFTGAAAELVAMAEELGPFPRHAGNYYPGHRRVINEGDGAANAYIERLCQAAAPFIAGAFDHEGFDLLEASFSMVTARPETLSPAQKAPHFDFTDPAYLALLHYLHVPDGTGTAFYRQRSTGIEQVSEGNISTFVRTAEREAAQLPSGAGYIRGSDEFFDQIGAVEGVADRLVIYQGSLLHSGVIPPDMIFSTDPRHGRLTANLFVRGH